MQPAVAAVSLVPPAVVANGPQFRRITTRRPKRKQLSWLPLRTTASGKRKLVELVDYNDIFTRQSTSYSFTLSLSAHRQTAEANGISLILSEHALLHVPSAHTPPPARNSTEKRSKPNQSEAKSRH
mmetsp:Transcript_40872/g.69468  ORF Transcript_40872/g.69468 Transcript_40872/m.69468 type:complete len:126 (-) Transcript_40872:57-434(-)